MNVQEFNFREMFNNSKGKTSLALLLCGIFGLAAAIGFVACGFVIVIDACFDTAVKTDINNYSMQCVALATLVFAYCSARRFTSDKDIITDAPNEKEVSQ